MRVHLSGDMLVEHVSWEQLTRLKQDQDFVVVTSDFHADRATFLFEREFPDRRITISTSTTDLPPEELSRRRDHEQKALDKLKNQGTT